MKKLIYGIIFQLVGFTFVVAETAAVKYDNYNFIMNSTGTNLSNGDTHVFNAFFFLGNYNHTVVDQTYYFHKSTTPELKLPENNPIITDFSFTLTLDCIDEFSREPDHDLPIAWLSLIGIHKDVTYRNNLALEPFTYDYIISGSDGLSINDLESGVTITMSNEKSFDTREYSGIYILLEANQENMQPIHFSQDSLVVFSATSRGTSSLEYTYTAIPEPSTYAMIFGTITLGVVAYRRRK